jgi:glucose-6-phosphate isomerase
MSSAVWRELQQLAQQPLDLRQEFARDPQRAERYALNAAGIELDYSKNLINQGIWQHLLQLAAASPLAEKRAQMFAGAKINTSEQRSVWHTALRAPASADLQLDGADISAEIADCHASMQALVEQLNSQQYLGYTGEAITDLIWIGIGGSLLGPQMAVEALTPYNISPLQIHFAGNIDGAVVSDVVQGLDPATTLVFVASKSFGTEETKQNALAVRQWFIDNGADKAAIARHFWATSSNIQAAADFGIESDHILPMWDWVGGRYSLWSAIGFPLCLMLGVTQFQQLLAGAHAMDQHFAEAPLEQNMPVILALLGVWYINGLGCQAQALLPYSHYLRLLPSYVQQLDMESNGKGVNIQGEALTAATAPVIWGDAGTNGQHAYHQLLHQSALVVPADFILPIKAAHQLTDHHHRLAAHCFAQTQALMQGKTLSEATAEVLAAGGSPAQAAELAPHKVSPGNKPSNTLLLPELSPYYLGALIALYEHKVFVQGVLWDINSFDQWGVELGKQLSTPIYQVLSGQQQHQFDASTSRLIRLFQQ